MRYAEAILICDNIAADSIGGREIDMDTKLSAVEKILKRANYLKCEIELAHRNAKAADTLGRYQEAAWWEERAQELINELKRIEGDTT